MLFRKKDGACPIMWNGFVKVGLPKILSAQKSRVKMSERALLAIPN